MKKMVKNIAVILVMAMFVACFAGMGTADLSLKQVFTHFSAEGTVYSQKGKTVSAVKQKGQCNDEEDCLDEDGCYDSKEDVALYLYEYGKLPSNYITKKEAQKLGWSGGSLEDYAPGKCIGGSYFGNNEGILPDGEYHECDIDTLGAKKRGAKRIVYSTDGDIYYTEDHYESFTLLYTADGPAEEEIVYD